MFTNGIGGQVSTDTFDQHHDQYLIDTSVDIQLGLHRHLGQQVANFRLMHMSESTISQLSTNC